MPDDPRLHEDNELPLESRKLLRNAYEHACEVLPHLDEESFVNGFLYGMRFGGTAEMLRAFMEKA